MPQVKIEKSNRFTQIENEVIQNPALSLKAKGLLVYMLSVPGDWDYSITGLSAVCKEGKAAIRSAIEELMEAGHIVRRIARSEDGTISGYEYTVYECPRPSSENRTTDGEGAQPSCDFPSSDYPSSENRTQQILDLTNTEVTNTPYSPPEGEAAPKGKKTKADYRPDWFEALWKRYPRKDGKQAARKAWNKLKPDRQTCELILAALERDKVSRQWTKDNGEYIPHLSTWLNQRRWENEGVDFSQLPAAATGGWAPDPEVTS